MRICAERAGFIFFFLGDPKLASVSFETRGTTRDDDDDDNAIETLKPDGHISTTTNSNG